MKDILTKLHTNYKPLPFAIVLSIIAIVVSTLSTLAEMLFGTPLFGIIGVVIAFISTTVGVFFYWIPVMVAGNTKDQWLVFWVNLLTGWMLLGWVVALVLAIKGRNA